MDAEFIIKSIIVLAIVLAILMFLLFLEPKDDAHSGSKSPEKPAPKVEKAQKQDTPSLAKPTLDSLVQVVKNKRSDAQKLSEALSLIIEYYGVITKKMGIRPHPDFDIYMDILFTLCRHPNTNKDIILGFDKELEKLNPEYKKEINEAIAKGLYSRGA